MNIFVLDQSPELCAQYHCDKHVVKMCVEYAQLLSTYFHLKGVTFENQYKPTHQNHPCSVWLREAEGNVHWTEQLFKNLLEEYTFRYGKVHASIKVYLGMPKTPQGPMTPFAQAMPDKRRSTDACSAYRSYYLNEKLHLLSWKRRTPPPFYVPTLPPPPPKH